MNHPRVACLAIALMICLGAVPALAAQDAVFQTSVAPRADEDLASNCQYEMTVLNPRTAVKIVWVILTLPSWATSGMCRKPPTAIL